MVDNHNLEQELGATSPADNEARGPLWKGPEEDGVTQSLLGLFLVCRERFRLLVVEGLKPIDTFSHRMEYGNLWHKAEEAVLRKDDWECNVMEYATELCRRYQGRQEQVQHWTDVCKIQFPIYVKHWKKHAHQVKKTPLLQEQVFDVPYTLPSGRIVKLRGKWDSIDHVAAHISEDGRKIPAGIWLQENKTKGDLDIPVIARQLKYDLQTMLYLIALSWTNEHDLDGNGLPSGKYFFNKPILGVRYNAVRRPLSGGKGSIVQHKPSKSNPAGESKRAFYERLGGIIEENAGEFFYRWNCEISQEDIHAFKRRTLNPILEQLCDWWEWVKSRYASRSIDPIHRDVFQIWGDTYSTPLHWQHPFGVYNPLLEGGSTDLDNCLATGSEVGLTRITTLFPELEP